MSKFTKIELVYALLALAGLCLTWYFNILFMQEQQSADAMAFIGAAYANHASTSISNDILVAATAFLIWMLREAKQLGLRYKWVFFVLTFGVAFAFACPLFLLYRERHIRLHPNPYETTHA